MRETRALQNFWRAHAGEKLMLCTIVRKHGSGYRAVGAKKIVTREGDTCGYLSGGCLDGDIVATARARWDEAPFIAPFSTMSEEDRLLGYQTGCAGILDILFERLPDGTAHMDHYLPFGPQPAFAAVGVSLRDSDLGARSVFTATPDAGDDLFVEPWAQPVLLQIIGAGMNVRPFADFALPLGWDVTFTDYRSGYEVPAAASRIMPVDEIAASVAGGPRSAIVLATHNYEADLNIMRGLVNRPVGYIGCIGPRRRFDQMRGDLQKLHSTAMDDDWAARVHAPAGLWQAREPAAIAFSIIAQIEQVFAGE